MDDIIIEYNGKRYIADQADVEHKLEVGVDETGAELVVTKNGVGCIVVQLKEVKSDD